MAKAAALGVLLKEAAAAADTSLAAATVAVRAVARVATVVKRVVKVVASNGKHLDGPRPTVLCSQNDQRCELSS